MLVTCLASLMLCMFCPASAASLTVHDDGVISGDSVLSLLQVTSANHRLFRSESNQTESNLYGAAQTKCGGQTCGIDPPAIHAICVSLPADFCEKTKQPDWCSAEAAKPHCVCLGAWSLYVKGGNAAPDVTCDAIPGSIFSDQYISSWSKWNGNEIGGQEADGLQALFDKCNTGSAADTFKTKFCTFVAGATHLSAEQKSTLSSHASCS